MVAGTPSAGRGHRSGVARAEGRHAGRSWRPTPSSTTGWWTSGRSGRLRLAPRGRRSSATSAATPRCARRSRRPLLEEVPCLATLARRGLGAGAGRAPGLLTADRAVLWDFVCGSTARERVSSPRPLLRPERRARDLVRPPGPRSRPGRWCSEAMCGIAGCVVAAGREPDRDSLAAMAAALGHRGPDDGGIEVVGNVRTGPRRLAIVDPSPAGHEPMHHPGRGWWLTYNGEVFNHLELRDEPSPARLSRGQRRRIPPARARVPRRGRAAGPQRVLRLGGVRPGGRAAVAGPRPVRGQAALPAEHGGRSGSPARSPPCWPRGCRGSRPRRPAPCRPARLGKRSGDPRRRRRARPARNGDAHRHPDAARAPRGGGTTRAEAVDPERMGELAARSGTEIDRAVEDATRASVHARLMADVPVGTMCSGGLDSSLITALAAERQQGLLAFNASVPGQPAADEGPWAERVCDALGVSSTPWRSRPRHGAVTSSASFATSNIRSTTRARCRCGRSPTWRATRA